ncbi:MAG: methyl-accepting chemotaxis protein [Neomegalonema sp.]|nr:methyl-accepting chemotaxis protein [Neomegalonema sp.]
MLSSAANVFKNVSISHKVMGLVLGGCLLVGASVAYSNYQIARGIAVQVAQDELRVEADGRVAAVLDYLDLIAFDMNFVAEHPQTRSALKSFDFAWNVMGDAPMQTLQDAYIHNNPYPVGEKHKLVDVKDDEVYTTIHADNHPVFRKLVEKRGYYDVFLINETGDVVYSVFKEMDYATNLVSGEFAGSDLGKAFQAVKANPAPGSQVFFDFAPYAPSAGAPASFIATPVLDTDGSFLGALAFQMPHGAITDIVRASDNPEHHHGAYLVGADGLLRIDASMNEVDDTLTTAFDKDFVSRVLSQGTHTADMTGLSGNEVRAFGQRVEFLGTQWALINEQDVEAIMAPAIALRNNMLTVTGIVMAIVSALAWFASLGFVRPIRQLDGAVSQLASGQTADVPGLDRGDELGTLARSLDAINDRAERNQQIRSALDSSQACVMLISESGTITYANTALVKLFARSQSYLAGRSNGLDVARLRGVQADTLADIPAFAPSSLSGTRAQTRTEAQFDNRAFDIHLSPVLNADGEVTGFVAEWDEQTEKREITRQVRQVIDAVASGDLTQRLDLKSNDSFFTDISGGVNTICARVGEFLDDIGATVDELAAGNLTRKVSGQYSGQYQQVASNLDNAIDRSASLVSQIANTARAVTKATTGITDGATELSRRSESQASSLQETAATMEEMSATVKSSAENASTANQMAGEVSSRAKEGAQVVTDAISAMGLIEQSSVKISDIIAVIDSIAFQTNLLALNAAVEAARAGDAGKGFAVVASEVRTLAQRSSAAAADIKELIQASSVHVSDGVRLVQASGESLQAMTGDIRDVSAKIEEIASASREQATGIQEISTAVSSLDQITQGNSTIAEESAAAARALTQLSGDLDALVNRFKISEQSSQFDEGKADVQWQQAAISSPQPKLAQPAAVASRAPVAAAASDWAEF